MDQEPFQVISGHKSDINSCDFGPRNTLATASSDRTIRIWNYDSREKKFVQSDNSPLKHHNYSVNEVRFSPQGTMMVTGSTDGTSVVWDFATLAPLCSFVQPSRLGVRVCRFSPDASMLVTAGDDDSACIWDISNRTLLGTLKDGEHTVFGADFTPNGENVITTDANGDLKLWNVRGDQKKFLDCFEEAHDLGILCCDFAIDKSSGSEGSLNCEFLLATGGNDNNVRLWSVTTGLVNKIRSMKILAGYHRSNVMCVRFSPADGRYLASCGGDKTTCIFSMESGELIEKIRHHDRYVGSCAFSRSGDFFASGSNDKTVAVFKWIDYSEKRVNLAESPEAGCSENKKRLSVLAAVEDAMLKFSITGYTSDVTDMTFTREDLVTCSGDKTVRIWSGENGRELRLLDRQNYAIPACDFCLAKNLLAVGSMNGYTDLWSTENWEKVATLETPTGSAVRTCRFSPDSAYVVIAGDDNKGHIFDVDTHKFVRDFDAHEATVFFACFSHDSSLVLTGCNDGIIFVWPLSRPSTRKKPIGSIEAAHDLGITCGDCRPQAGTNGSSLVVTGGNDSLIKAWRVEQDGKMALLKAISGHGSSLMSLKFAFHGRIFASTSGDKTCRLWGCPSFTCLRVIDGHDRYVTCCAFSYDARKLATGSNDKSANVWSLAGALADFFAPDQTESDKLSQRAANSSEGQAASILSTNGGKKSANLARGDEVPEEFLCPITQDVMKFPVLCADGFVYEKAAILEWLVSRRKTSPMTNLPMETTVLTPQNELRNQIRAFLRR